MSLDIQKELPGIFRQKIEDLHSFFQGKDSFPKEKAVSILKDVNCSATDVLLSSFSLIGNQFLSWEPESIWKELEDKGVELPLENRDKLQACLTCIKGDSFFWDALGFEKIISAFNSIPISSDTIQEMTPAQIAWGVLEATVISNFAGNDHDFDYEPAKYTAVSLHRAGFVLAPSLLVFAQYDLDGLNRDNDKELKQEVIKKWGQLDKSALEKVELGEDPTDIQVARLVAVDLYLSTRLQA